MSKFTPASFENIGKAVTDLFKKKYDYKNQVQLKNKSQTGLTVTSTGEASEKDVSGTLNLKYKEKFGEAEAEVTTSGKAKAEVKAKNLAQGVVATVKGESNPKREGVFASKPGAKAAAVKTTVDYTRDFFTGNVALDTSFFDYSVVSATGVVGYEGVSAGIEGKFDVQTRSDVDDYNGALQYEHKNLIGSVKTENKFQRLTLGFFQKVNDKHSVGASFGTALNGSGDRVLKLGEDFKVDDVTSFRAKGEVNFKGAGTSGLVAGVLEHRLKNPSLLFALSSSYNVNGIKAITPAEFGIALTFGDFE